MCFEDVRMGRDSTQKVTEIADGETKTFDRNEYRFAFLIPSKAAGSTRIFWNYNGTQYEMGRRTPGTTPLVLSVKDYGSWLVDEVLIKSEGGATAIVELVYTRGLAIKDVCSHKES